MPKHRKNTPPAAYETFAALGVVLFLLILVAAVGALIASVI